MISGNDERIALDITSTADPSGIRQMRAETTALGQTAQQMNEQAAAAANKGAAAQNGLNGALRHQTEHLQKLSPEYRKGARDLSGLAYAASGAGGGLREATIAAGGMAMAIAQLSENAELAASAAGIGALVIAVGVLIGMIKQAHDEMNKLNTPTGTVNDVTRQHIDNLKTVQQVEQDIANTRQEQASAIARVEQMNDENRIARATKDLATQDTRAAALQREADLGAKLNALYAKRIALTEDLRKEELASLQAEAAAAETPAQRFGLAMRAIEAERREAIRTHALTEEAADAQAAARRRDLIRAENEAVQRARNDTAQLIGELQSATEAKRRAIQIQYADELRALQQMTLQESARREILQSINDKREYGLKLLEREVNLMNARQRAETAAQSDNVKTSYEAKLRLIEQERVAAIRAGQDVEVADAEAERKKRALMRETARQASENAKTLYQVLQSSHDKTLKAVGTFAENVRRLVIGADAAKAGVKAAIEGAEAIASLASGDFRGAALHGAAALEFAKASALGFQEAGGGGGASAGGGAAGAGSGAGDTFTPRDQSGNGPVTVVIQTVDPTSREVIGQVRWALQRQDVTKVPISSTAAFRPAGIVGVAA